MALGTEPIWIRVGAGSSAGVEREHPVAGVDEREQIAAHPAQVRSGDGDRSIGRDRGIDCVAPGGERAHAGLRGELIGGRDHGVRGADR